MSFTTGKDVREAAKIGAKMECLYFYLKEEIESGRSIDDETVDFIEKNFSEQQLNDYRQKMMDFVMKEVPTVDFTKEDWQENAVYQVLEQMKGESSDVFRKILSKELDLDTAWKTWCEVNPSVAANQTKEQFKITCQLISNEPVSTSDLMQLLTMIK